MKKNLLIFILLLIPLNVRGVDQYTETFDNVSFQQCLEFSSYNDARKTISGSGYYGTCRQYSCQSGKYVITGSFDTNGNNQLKCENGNYNYYRYDTGNNGCAFINYSSKSCVTGMENKYCTLVVYYDCNRNSDGSKYVGKTTAPTTTTTTKKIPKTTRKTTEPITTVFKDNNAYLQSIKISIGEIINFQKDVFEYNIEVPEETNYIDVEALPESTKANVSIYNNTEIKENVPILIKVTTENGSILEYKININFITISSNNLIKNITIDGYKLDFTKENNEYTLKVNQDTSKLKIKVELDDEKASYVIDGNKDLKNGSVIKIKVTAENKEENIYYLNIEKDEVIKETPKKKSNVLIILLIIIIVGVLGFIAYKLYNKFMPAKDDDKYDYE